MGDNATMQDGTKKTQVRTVVRSLMHLGDAQYSRTQGVISGVSPGWATLSKHSHHCAWALTPVK